MALICGCGNSTPSEQQPEQVGSAQQALTLGVPLRIKALDYNAFQDSDTTHEGNCGSGPVDAETTTDPNGGCDVGWTHPGEWLEYSLQVATAGKFHIVPRVASALSGKTFRVSLDGVDLGGSLSVPSGGWQAFANRPIKDVSLSSGAHTLRVSFETGDTNFVYVDVTPGTVTLPARIEAESYQRSYDSTPTTNTGNACDRRDGVDKENTGDTAGGGCNVGWTTPGEWLEYDVNVVQAGSYNILARVGSGTNGHTVRLSVDGTDVGTLSVPNVGWSSFQDRTLTTNLATGAHVLRVTFPDGDTNLNYLNITSNMPSPVVVPHRIAALAYSAFQDSDTLHEGNCGSGPVDAETTTDPSGGTCDVAYTHPGEWLEYIIQAPTSGKYSLTARVASALSGKTVRLLVDGQNVSGALNVPSGGWQAFSDRGVKDVSLTAGTHTVRVAFETGDTNFNYLDVAPGTVDLPARIEAENYQRAFDSTAATNSGNACDRGDGVDKENTADMAGGGCNIGWTTSTDWLEYDVKAAQAGAFDITARVGSGVDGRTLQLALDGTSLGTLAVPNIGWTGFQDRTLSNVSFSAGTHTLRVSFPQGETNLNYLTFNAVTPSSVPPSTAQSFGAAADYNVFLFEDLQNTPSITGPVAVGRDISTQSFGYNTASSGSIGVLVGRSITASGGSIHRDLVYGVSQNLTNAGVLDGVVRQASPLNFTNEKTYAQGLAAAFAALTSNGTTTITQNGTTIDFVGTDSLRNVFTVDGQVLGLTDVLSFVAPSTSTVVVNVTGSSASFETGGVQLGRLAPGHLIWNFRDATTVRMSQMGFKGTVLAPNAIVSQNGVDFEGVLIAQSLYGTDNGLTWAPFNGVWPFSGCASACAAKACGDDVADGCGGTCLSTCDNGEAGCKNDFDCPAGSVCGRAIGARFGYAANVNVCWPVASSTYDRELDGPDGLPAGSGTLPACVADCSGNRLTDGCGGYCLTPGVLQQRGPGGSVFTPVPVIPPGGPLFPTPLPAQATSAVGAVPGVFEVTDQGNANYTIPIEVPPGRLGMQPNLALKYLGTKANGMLGLGWGLTGLSTIERCRSTNAELSDLRPPGLRPVMLDDDDRFCLDGETLVQVHASNGATYGADGAEYVLERDTTKLRITSHSVGTVRTAYFTAIDRDGRKLSYGRNGAVVDTFFGPRVWALEDVEDTAKNFMTIRYHHTDKVGWSDQWGLLLDNGELLPSLISYGGSRANAVADAARDESRFVVFDYERRDDPVTHYVAGQAAFSNWRIKSIETVVQNTPVRKYRIDYQIPIGSGGTTIHANSKIASISECAADPTTGEEVCKRPTTFEYLTAGAAYQATTLIGNAASAPQMVPIVFDSNGDGRDDLLIPSTWKSLSATVQSRWAGSNPASAQFDVVKTSPIQGVPACINQGSVIDLDHDGKDELVSSCPNGDLYDGVNVLRPQGTGTPIQFAPDPNQRWANYWDVRPLLADLHGDGDRDLVLCITDPSPYRTRIEVHENTGTGSFSQEIVQIPYDGYCGTLVAFDADGDGDDDLINTFGIRTPNGFERTMYRWQPSTQAWLLASKLGVYELDRTIADVNGDGLKDFVGTWNLESAPTHSVIVWLNTGGHFDVRILALVDAVGSPADWPSAVGKAFDFDGDGVDELLLNNKILKFVDTGHALLVDATAGFPAGGGNPAVADLNGDGSPELVFSEGVNLTFASQGAGHASLLRSVTDGLGRTDEVDYEGDYLEEHHQTLTRTYTPDACLGASYSSFRTCLRRVAPLVSSHRQKQVDSATSETKWGTTTHFTYSGAVVETGRHGWLGFSQRTISVPDLSFTKIDYVVNDFRQAGLPFRSEEILTNSSSEYALASARRYVTDYGWFDYNVQSPNPDASRFVFLRAKTEAVFSDENAISVKKTDTFVDEFNSIIFQQETVTSGTSDLVSRTTVNSPRLNNVYAGKIGLPDAVDIQSERAGASTHRAVDFGYDDRGLLATVVREPNTPQSSTYQKTVLTPNELGVVDSKCVITSQGETEQRCVSVELDDWSIFPQFVTEVGESLTTEYIYSAETGALTTRTEPSGVATEFAYDAFGRVNYVHSPKRQGPVGYVAAAPVNTDLAQVKAWGALTTITQFAGEGTTFTTYDPFGRIVQTRSTGLNDTVVVSETLFDQLGRPKVSSLPHAFGSATQGVRSYGYNSNGHLETVTEPDNSVTRIEMADAENVLPVYASWFDDDDAIEAMVVKLPRGNQKVYLRDHNGNVVRSFDDPNGLGGSELSTRFEYGPFDLVRKVITPKETTQFWPDDLGRPATVQATATGTLLRTFNGFDELESETDGNGSIATFRYDRAGRMVEKRDAADAIIAKWEYDGAAGRGLGLPFRSFRRSSPTSTTGIWVEQQYEDGSRGRPIRTTYRVGTDLTTPEAGGEVFQVGVSYKFNAPGQVDTIEYPDNAGAFVVQQSYDLGGNLRSVVPFGKQGQFFWRLDVADEGLRPADEVFGNGVETVRTYHHVGEADPCGLDPDESCAPGLLSGIFTQGPGNTLLQNTVLTSDRNGNLRSINENLAPTTRFFTYDGLDRIASERESNHGVVTPVREYLYDSVGNMAAQTGLPAYAYDPTTSRLDRVGDTEYHYDGNGNQYERVGSLVAGGYQRLDLNDFEMPWHVSQGQVGAQHDTYLEYDADEERVVKREQLSGGGERITLTIGDLYERVTTPNGVEHHFKVYGGGGQIAEVVRHSPGEDTDTVTYLHPDHLGSPRILTGATGQVQENRDFGLFGEEQGAVNWSSTNIRSGFTAHSHDDGLGLVNMKGRLYDSAVGRFISADPIVSNPFSALGWDRYAYAENNPLSRLDPSGFEWNYWTESPAGGTFYGFNAGSGSGGGHNPGSRQGQGAASGGGHAPQAAGPGPGAEGHAPGAGMAPDGGPSSMGGPSGPSGPAMGQPSLSDPRSRPMDVNKPQTFPRSTSPGLGIAPAAAAPVVLGPALELTIGAMIAGVTIAKLTNEIRKNTVNLDTGALIDLTSADPRSFGIFMMLATKNWVTTPTALIEFAKGLRRMGPIEKMKAALMLARTRVVQTVPSFRAAKLRMTKGIGLADILIFGTGDFLHIQTYTTDGRALRAAEAQGVTFDAVELPALSHLGK